MSPTRLALLLAFVPLLALVVYAAFQLPSVTDRNGGEGAVPGTETKTFAWGRADPFPTVQFVEGRPLPQGDVFRSAVPEPETLNHLVTRFSVTHRLVARYTHDSLCDLDPIDGTLRPALAESFEADPENPLLWWFTIRAGASFADGQPVTINDVLWTYATVRNEKLAPSLLSETLRGVDLVMPDKVSLAGRKFGLRLRPEMRFALTDVATDFRVVQRRWFEEQLAVLASPARPPTPTEPAFPGLLEKIRTAGPATGPYKLSGGPEGDVAWVPDHELVLVQNPLSWQRAERPESWNLAGMRLRFIQNRTAQWAALERGEIDWIADSGDVTERLAGSEVLRHVFRSIEYTTRTSSHYYCEWNHHIEELRNPQVRRALTMLFDREHLVTDLLDGRAHIATSWLPPDHPSYPDVTALPYDTQRARRLLEEQGYTDQAPLKLRLMTDGRPPYGGIANALVHAARECGNVRLEIAQVPWSVLAAERQAYPQKRASGALLVHGHGFVVDPSARFGPGNELGFQDDEHDKLLAAIAAAPDDASRAKALGAWARYFHRIQPITLLAHPRLRVLLHRRFKEAKPTEHEGLMTERWWVPVAEQIVR